MKRVRELSVLLATCKIRDEVLGALPEDAGEDALVVADRTICARLTTYAREFDARLGEPQTPSGSANAEAVGVETDPVAVLDTLARRIAFDASRVDTDIGRLLAAVAGAAELVQTDSPPRYDHRPWPELGEDVTRRIRATSLFAPEIDSAFVCAADLRPGSDASERLTSAIHARVTSGPPEYRDPELGIETRWSEPLHEKALRFLGESARSSRRFAALARDARELEILVTFCDAAEASRSTLDPAQLDDDTLASFQRSVGLMIELALACSENEPDAPRVSARAASEPGVGGRVADAR